MKKINNCNNNDSYNNNGHISIEIINFEKTKNSLRKK